jgi:hypothetical protein
MAPDRALRFLRQWWREKTEASRALGDDLAPSFSERERSLDREDGGVGRIPAEVLDRWEDKIRLPVDDGLRCELSTYVGLKPIAPVSRCSRVGMTKGRERDPI